MKQKKFLIMAVAVLVVLAIMISLVMSMRKPEGVTTGTIKITCEGEPIESEKVSIKESEKNTRCEIWQEKNTYRFELETPEKAFYNLRITLEGELLKKMQIREKTLTHDFQIFPVNDGMNIEVALTIDYIQKNGEWVALIKSRAIDDLGKRENLTYHNEEEFTLKEKNHTLMGIE